MEEINEKRKEEEELQNTIPKQRYVLLLHTRGVFRDTYNRCMLCAI